MKKLAIIIITLYFGSMSAWAKSLPACNTYEKSMLSSRGGIITAVKATDDSCSWALTAVPNAGYQFAQWTTMYGVPMVQNPCTISIDRTLACTSIRAMFVRSDAYIYSWTANGAYIRSTTTQISEDNFGRYDAYIDNIQLDEENSAIDSIDFGVRHIITTSTLANNANAGKHIQINLFNGCGAPSARIDTIVPVIIAGDSAASNMAFYSINPKPHADVQVTDGATFTIDANTTINGFLDIHEGAKVVVEEGKNLTVNGIIMRGNGITKEWPQLEVDGTITNNNNDTIYYDYTLDQHAYYPLTLPFEVNCSEVYNPINKAAASYQAYTYNTENRENSVYAWDEFDDTVLGAKFVAGKGYIVYAVPTKWRGVKALRQQEAVVRFPMVADFSRGGEAEKLVDIYSNPSGEVYDCSNWNLIGNPYLKNITMGHVNVGKYRAYQGNLDGAGNFVEAAPPGSRSLNYITYSDDGFRSYQHEELSNFVMKPFNSYLTQTSVGSKLQFAKITTPLAAPRRAQTSSEEDVEIIRTGLLLSQGDEVDHIGLLFGDYTYDYEVNADLAKQFGEAQPMSVYSLMGNIPMAYQALPIDAMNRPVPVGYRKADITSMTFSFDDSRYAREQIEELWLTDLVTGQTVNLLDEDYTFTPESAQDDSRFYLSCERRKVVEIATDVEETTQQQTIIRVFDMFGREMHGDVNALPQGVYILMDNLGNTKKEILGQ